MHPLTVGEGLAPPACNRPSMTPSGSGHLSPRRPARRQRALREAPLRRNKAGARCLTVGAIHEWPAPQSAVRRGRGYGFPRRCAARCGHHDCAMYTRPTAPAARFPSSCPLRGASPSPTDRGATWPHLRRGPATGSSAARSHVSHLRDVRGPSPTFHNATPPFPVGAIHESPAVKLP